MKNGDRFFFLLALVLIGYSIGRNKSKKSLEQYKKDPTISQYINRLKEFYNDIDMDKMEDEFLSLIDFGVHPKYAFEAVIFNGELN